jgi:tetratricopeptide (TPR) repeat protein
MKILPYLFLLSLLVACGPSVTEKKAAVDTAFTAYQNEPSDSSAQTLLVTLGDYSKSKAKIEDKNITADTILKFIALNMFNDSTFRLNEPRAELYIDAVETAVKAEPALAKAPEYLHYAAETARTLRDIPKAIELYDWIIATYPSHPRAATSLFLKAFTYDNDLKEFDKAGVYYKDYLAKYPNDEFSESAKFLLDNLGKSEEELKKMLEEKSKENVQ